MATNATDATTKQPVDRDEHRKDAAERVRSRDWNGYARSVRFALARELGIDGAELTPKALSDKLPHEFPSDRDRFTVWCLESMLVAFRALGADGCRWEPTLAFRCLLQATEYRGRLGGNIPGGPGVNDAHSALRNAIGDLV